MRHFIHYSHLLFYFIFSISGDLNSCSQGVGGCLVIIWYHHKRISGVLWFHQEPGAPSWRVNVKQWTVTSRRNALGSHSGHNRGLDFFFLLRAKPVAYGNSQVSGQIRTAAEAYAKAIATPAQAKSANCIAAHGNARFLTHCASRELLNNCTWRTIPCQIIYRRSRPTSIRQCDVTYLPWPKHITAFLSSATYLNAPSPTYASCQNVTQCCRFREACVDFSTESWPLGSSSLRAPISFTALIIFSNYFPGFVGSMDPEAIMVLLCGGPGTSSNACSSKSSPSSSCSPACLYHHYRTVQGHIEAEVPTAVFRSLFCLF